jgi:DNA-binding CsgD family transcriptional regulator
MHVGIHRPRQKGAFTTRERRLLEFFTPHLRRVTKLSKLMMELNQSLSETQEALDHLSFSVWQMDARLNPTWMNCGAQEIFSQGTYGLHLRDNRLNCHSPGVASSLRAMVANLLEKRSYTETLRISPNGACLVMTLSCACGSGVRIGRSAKPGILCFLLDPELPARLDHAQLKAMYRLTPAELRLANLLVTGLDVAEASAVLQISKHTGRTQLKSIMHKTGVNRQAGLQRKFLICAGMLRDPDA